MSAARRSSLQDSPVGHVGREPVHFAETVRGQRSGEGHRALPGSVHSQRAELKKGDCRSGRSYPEKLFPLSFSSLRGELSAFEMDAQYAARAAHAYDPSVLDAGTT